MQSRTRVQAVLHMQVVIHQAHSISIVQLIKQSAVIIMIVKRVVLHHLKAVAGVLAAVPVSL